MFPNPTRAAVAQPRRTALAAPSGRWPARALSGLGAAATLALTACGGGSDAPAPRPTRSRLPPMYAMALIAVAVSAVPLLLIIRRVCHVPLRSWLPILVCLGAILLIQAAAELVGQDAMTAFIYLMAGVGR